MKINKKPTIKKMVEEHPDVTTNYEDGIAFTMDDETRLYSRVASCLVGESKFYKNTNGEGEIEENQDKDLIKDIQLVAKINPEFILKLARYTRNVLNLRTISIILLVEASLIDECKPYVKKYTPMIVQRADEFVEAVAYLQKKIGNIGNKSKKGSMPAGLKKGLANAFQNFNEYELAKYNRDGFVKLKDVMRLTHPKPKDKEQGALWKSVLDGTIKSPETWEVVISTKGSTRENWTTVYPSMGYMAVLRNLRNFLDKEVSVKMINDVAAKLSNVEQVRKSRQLPFRYLSAYRELERNRNVNTVKVLDALQIALDTSVENLPKLKGTTYILADNSGSMSSPLSERSKVSYKDTANTMLAIAHKICENPITATFADRLSILNLSKRNGVISNVKEIERVDVGGSTNAFLGIQYLNDNKIKVDRIILFSDMQCYDTNKDTSSWIGSIFGSNRNIKVSTVYEELKKYKANINPNVYVYSVDLAGYGTAQIPKDESRVCLLAGWSERVLEYIKLFEEDKKAVISRIQSE